MNIKTEVKILKKEEELFTPQTARAKKLFKKIELFNELAEYFKSSEAQEIMSNDLNMKVGEKYVSCDEKKPSIEQDYVSPGKFSIKYRSTWVENEPGDGTAYVHLQMVPVTKTGKIGVKPLNTYLFQKDKGWKETFYLKKIDPKFVPGKRREFLGTDATVEFVKGLKKKDRLFYDYHKVIKDAFADEGIKMDFQFIREMPSDRVVSHRCFMLRSDFEKLYEEAVKLDYPCMLHNPEPAKSRAKALIKGGYIERMMITRVKNKVNTFFKENGYPKTKMSFNFKGNSLLMFHQANMSIMTEKTPGFSSGSSFEVEQVDSFNF